MIPKQLLAGTAIVDITPPLSNRIYGDFISHYSQTNHEKLYSKALALKGSEETVVLVLVDICYVQDLFFRSIRKDLEQKTGLPEKNFLFCYTHTHSADLLHNASDLPYLRKLFVLIIDSVISALGKLVPAKISFGSADVSKYFVSNKCLTQKGYETNYTVKGKSNISITNLYDEKDMMPKSNVKMDILLSYLAVKDINDQWVSLFANYSLHNIGDFEQNSISADYFEEFVSQIKHILKAGDDFIGILSKGTSWKSNIWDFLNNGIYPNSDYEKNNLIAKSLARHIAASLNELVWNNEIDISTEYEDLYLYVTKPSQKEFEETMKVVEESNYEDETIIDNDILRRIYRKGHVLLSQKGEKEILPLQAIKIGKRVIGTLAGEFFTEKGLWMQQNTLVKNFSPKALPKEV